MEEGCGCETREMALEFEYLYFNLLDNIPVLSLSYQVHRHISARDLRVLYSHLSVELIELKKIDLITVLNVTDYKV